MLRDVSGVDALAIRADAIQMLVDIRDAVLPKLRLPFGSRQFVLEWRLLAGATSANAIQRRRLTSLLVKIHLS